MSNLTQHEKIIKIMEKDPNRWYRAYDFMQPNLGDLFVGYEATARLSELCKRGDLEKRMNGKYREVKLIVEQPKEQPKAISWLND